MTTPRLSLGLWCTLGLIAVSAPGHAGTFRVTPQITCIEPSADHTFFIAYFGYDSRESSLVLIEVGANNRFTPGPESRGQLTVFVPGYFPRAFRIVFAPSQSAPELNWQFLGTTVTADWTSPLCDGVPLPDPIFREGFEATL